MKAVGRYLLLEIVFSTLFLFVFFMAMHYVDDWIMQVRQGIRAGAEIHWSSGRTTDGRSAFDYFWLLYNIGMYGSAFYVASFSAKRIFTRIGQIFFWKGGTVAVVRNIFVIIQCAAIYFLYKIFLFNDGIAFIVGLLACVLFSFVYLRRFSLPSFDKEVLKGMVSFPIIGGGACFLTSGFKFIFILYGVILGVIALSIAIIPMVLSECRSFEH